MYGGDHKIAITLRDMTDIEMFRIMGLENSEDWMNPVQYTEQVIKQARAFFDSWLDLSRGALSAEQGSKLVHALAGQARLVELEELERRITALEGEAHAQS